MSGARRNQKLYGELQYRIWDSTAQNMLMRGLVMLLDLGDLSHEERQMAERELERLSALQQSRAALKAIIEKEKAARRRRNAYSISNARSARANQANDRNDEEKRTALGEALTNRSI